MNILGYLFLASFICFIGYKAYVVLLKKYTKKPRSFTGGSGGSIVDEQPRENNRGYKNLK